jgi:starch synthase
MDLLLVTPELAPYVVETHAAEAIAALAKSLRLLGHDVTIAVPRYSAFEQAGLLAARRLTPLRLEGGAEVVVLDAQLPSGVKLTLFDAPRLFDRPGVYGEGGQEYEDNPKRFGFFSDCVEALVRSRAEQGKTFDVVHLHDFAAGLSAVKLASRPGPTVPTVLTVHDGALTGTYSAKAREDLGIPEEFCHQEGFRIGTKLCVLKGAVSTVDRVVTTSPTYATHLESPERFGALSRAFREGGAPCVGVLGGVDYSLYNPATDSALASRYDAEDISNKARNKSAVVRELGLEVEVARPLFFAEAVPGGQSGLDTLAATLRALAKNELQIVVATDAQNEAALRAAAEPLQDAVRVVSRSSERLVRRLVAGADFYLGLERSNPSAHAVLRAQRYGTVPVAFAVDAAVDAVVDCDAELETGTGFLFDAMTQRALAGAVARALAAYGSPRFPLLVRRIARQDLGWDRAARRYAQIYRQTLAAHA